MQEYQELSSSMEDYLETIIVLQNAKTVVRVSDIGKALNVSKPSVNSALSNLSKQGYVMHEKYGHVELTVKGDKYAKIVLKRHNVLCDFLQNILKVDPKLAEEDACKIEHLISSETFDKLVEYMESV